jgi:hypothetical protein
MQEDCYKHTAVNEEDEGEGRGGEGGLMFVRNGMYGHEFSMQARRKKKKKKRR